MAPKVYGWQHLTFLAIIIVVFVATILLIKFFAKTEKQKTIAIKVIAGSLLVAVLINRISLAVRYHSFWNFFPDTYCGMTSLVLALVVLFGKANNKAYHFLWYMGLIGGLATMFAPDFLGQNESFLYLPTISGMIHHSLLLLLIFVMCQIGWFRPSLKMWRYFPIGLSIYTLIGLFEMDVFGWDNAMVVAKPLVSGTFLTWWVVLLGGSAVLFVFLILYEFLDKKIKQKRTARVGQVEIETNSQDSEVVVADTKNAKNDAKIAQNDTKIIANNENTQNNENVIIADDETATKDN